MDFGKCMAIGQQPICKSNLKEIYPKITIPIVLDFTFIINKS